MAIAAENAEEVLRDLTFVEMVMKMQAYQEGTGPSPTNEEFNLWREGAARALKRRALTTGFGDL